MLRRSLLGAIAQEHRLAVPKDLDDLAFGDRREVDVNRDCSRDCCSIGIHLMINSQVDTATPMAPAAAVAI